VEIEVFNDAEELAHAAAVRFQTLAQSSVARQDRFSVALAGGNTPRRVYELLATDDFKQQINWPSVHMFFGDERPVPHDHPASNYRMAFETLLSKVSIPVTNVHPMKGIGDPHANARAYESELRSFFGGVSWPRFDLVLLGMGEDGHTASLFPDSPALNEIHAWVVANWIEKLGEFRVTLTAPAINAAANVIFLVAGEEKTESLHEILRGPSQPAHLPAQLISPKEGSLTWMVDAAAATRLRVSSSEFQVPLDNLGT
jgi:6-phosphogluconolactonase